MEMILNKEMTVGVIDQYVAAFCTRKTEITIPIYD